MQMQSLENLENKFLTFQSSPTCRFIFSDIVIASPWKNSTFLFAVLDALLGRFFRSDISAETLWVGGWLLRQLLPYSGEDSSRYHPELLKELHKNYVNCLLGEVTEIRCDVLIAAIIDAWKKCKRAIEVSALQKDPKNILWPPQTFLSEGESSSFSRKRMYETVKVFVLSHQIQIFSAGEKLPDLPSLCSSLELPVNSRAKSASLDDLGPNPGTEINFAAQLEEVARLIWTWRGPYYLMNPKE